MPIKSRAQRRKFAELLVEGKISPDVYERWNRGAGYKELPEHVTPKDKSKSRRKTSRGKKKTTRRTAKSTAKRRSTTKKRSRRSG